VSALAATTELTSAATADGTSPVGDEVDITDDVGTVSLDEEGLFELQADITEFSPGTSPARSWCGSTSLDVKKVYVDNSKAD
jgi:hypothetical protein